MTFSEGNYLSEVPEEGWHRGKCVSIEAYKGEQKYETPSYYVRWEIPKLENKTVRELMSGTLSEKSRMYARWVAVGGEALEAEDEVDLDDMVGGECELFLENKKSKKGSDFVNVLKVRALKGGKKPAKEEVEEETEEETEDEEEEAEEATEEEAEDEEEEEEVLCAYCDNAVVESERKVVGDNTYHKKCFIRKKAEQESRTSTAKNLKKGKSK